MDFDKQQKKIVNNLKEPSYFNRKLTAKKKRTYISISSL